MEENSDSQMETDVSSTTQDLPSPQEATPTSSMEVTVEIAETTMSVEELKEEAQDQSIDSNTPEMETSDAPKNIISPKKIAVENSDKLHITPDKDVVLNSPQKEAIVVHRPKQSVEPKVLENSIVKSVEKTPSKENTLDKSPSKVNTLDKTPTKVIMLDKSPPKIVILDKSPPKVVLLENSLTKASTLEKSPAKANLESIKPLSKLTLSNNLENVPTTETLQAKPSSTENIPVKVAEQSSSDADNTKKTEKSKTEVIKVSDEVSEIVPEKTEVSNVSSVETLIEPSTNSPAGSETPTSELSEKEHGKSLSRELKSLINSAKESKIISECTQLTSKTRKSRTPLDTSITEGKKVGSRRGSANSQQSESSEKSDKAALKRSMRSQNPEFVTKQKQFLNSVTGKKNEEMSDADMEPAKSKETTTITTIVDKKISDEKVSETKIRYDSYCWRCHWPAESAANEKSPKPVSCTVCPRTYHFKCLTGPERSSAEADKGWVCPECSIIMQAESSETRSPAMRKITLGMLCDLLKYALKRMLEVNGVEPFTSPVDRTVFPEYDKFVVHPMDLSLVRANIEGGYYGSTEAFAGDVQWILHNSIIFNTLQSKLTAAARALLRSCRAEMGEIEACPECYAAAHARRATWFTDVCSAPHILLWAKLKGFPYWPAKGMTVSSAGMVDVRFFGAHDRAWVPARDCFLYSEKDPNNFKAKRQDIIDSMQEAEEHIRNISRKFGKFVYPPYKVQFEPSKMVQQLKMMIPCYEPELPKPKTKPLNTSPGPASLKIKRKSLHKERDESPKSKKLEDSPKPASTKQKRKSICLENEERPGPASIKTRRKSHLEERPGPASTKNRRKSTYEESLKDTPGPASFKNKRKSMSKGEGAEESPRPKRKVAEKDSDNTDAGEDKAKMSENTSDTTNKEMETRKRRRSVLEEADELTVMENQEKKPRIDPAQNTTEGTKDNDPRESEDPPTTENESEKTQENEGTPKANDNETSESTPKTKQRATTRKIIIKQATKPKTPKSVEKPKATAREKSLSSEKEKSSDEKSKKPKKKPASDAEPKDSGKASPAPKSKPDQTKTTSSPKPKDDDNTKLANMAKKKANALNMPLLISNVRSLSKTPNSSPKATPAEVTQAQSDSSIFTPTSTDNVNNMKDAMAKLQRLRTDGDKNMVGKVGVRAFARMTSPPAGATEKVTVEVKAEPIDVDEADRQSEKIDLMNSFKLRPVHPNNLRDYRMNKGPVVANNVRKPCPKPVEVHPRAKKTFPQPKKPDEGRSELNSKNSMVYIPIQPPMTTPPRAPAPRTSCPNGVPALRPTAPAVNTGGPLVSPAVRPAPTMAPTMAPTLAPTLGAVHTVPFITSVNGQWAFSLQPVMAVGSQDCLSQGTSPPQLNGLDRPIPLPTSMSNPPPLVASDAPLSVSNTPPAPVTPSVTVPSVATNMIQPVQPPILLPSMSTNAEKNTPEELPRLQQKPGLEAPVEVTPPAIAGPVTAKLYNNAQKLVDLFRKLFEESLDSSSNPKARLAAARQQIETINWRYTQQIKELKHNHELQIAEMRTSFEKERRAILSEAARVTQADLEAAVRHAKSRQWCANCQQEAQFYCCWNTSYCDYPCQRAHWAQHHADCTQQRNNGGDRTIPAEERLQPPELPKASPSSMKTVGGKVMPPRIAPAPTAPKSSIIVSMVEDTGGNQTVKCVGTYKPTSSPLIINKQIMSNEENAQKKVVTSGGYLIVGAGAPNTSTASVVIN